MPYTIKISLMGLSGSGKTTTLKSLTKESAYLMCEQKRPPSEEEMKAWRVAADYEVPTSSVPNFGNVVLRPNFENGTFKMLDHIPENLDKHEIIAYVYDTCGQEIFYQITKATSEGSQGLIFLVDSTLELKQHSKEIVDVFNTVESHFQGNMPPTVIVCNKQDLVQKFRIEEGGFGKELFMRSIMRSYEQKFATIPFIDACAKDGWGVDKALELLVEEICKDYVFMKDSKIPPRGFSKINTEKTIKREKFSYYFENESDTGFHRVD